MIYESANERETEKIGADFAKTLKSGDIVALRGGLGMGKTAFVRGMAAGLSSSMRVTSPTFTIVNEYDGLLPLFHFDIYRLSCGEELYEIGWEDYIARGGVCVVEWSEIAEEMFDKDCITVSITRGNTENSRIITVER